MIERGATKVTLANLLGVPDQLPPGAADAARGLRDAVDAVLRRAQDAGVARADVSVDELYISGAGPDPGGGRAARAHRGQPWRGRPGRPRRWARQRLLAAQVDRTVGLAGPGPVVILGPATALAALHGVPLCFAALCSQCR